jgi:hypothetical protein
MKTTHGRKHELGGRTSTHAARTVRFIWPGAPGQMKPKFSHCWWYRRGEQVIVLDGTSFAIASDAFRFPTAPTLQVKINSEAV